jgi:molecular chaperone GrpE
MAEDEVEIELEDVATPSDEIEETMREAVAAVEDVEDRRRSGGADDAVDVDRLQQELADLRDRSMRTLADFDNFRKRSERERQELRRYAVTEPMRDLLEVVDNLERALDAGGSAEDLKQGVEMIARQLKDLMRRNGVEAVDAEGQPFDPSVHEAVQRHDSEEVTEQTVAEVYQKGYRIHDRLLRPAMVSVAVPVKSS